MKITVTEEQARKVLQVLPITAALPGGGRAVDPDLEAVHTRLVNGLRQVGGAGVLTAAELAALVVAVREWLAGQARTLGDATPDVERVRHGYDKLKALHVRQVEREGGQ